MSARSAARGQWTMAIALLHPLAYVYTLYMKDADMLFLTTAAMAAFYKYLTLHDSDRLSWKLAAVPQTGRISCSTTAT